MIYQVSLELKSPIVYKFYASFSTALCTKAKSERQLTIHIASLLRAERAVDSLASIPVTKQITIKIEKIFIPPMFLIYFFSHMYIYFMTICFKSYAQIKKSWPNFKNFYGYRHQCKSMYIDPKHNLDTLIITTLPT